LVCTIILGLAILFSFVNFLFLLNNYIFLLHSFYPDICYNSICFFFVKYFMHFVIKILESPGLEVLCCDIILSSYQHIAHPLILHPYTGNRRHVPPRGIPFLSLGLKPQEPLTSSRTSACPGSPFGAPSCPPSRVGGRKSPRLSTCSSLHPYPKSVI
jgi:hypothetical protein